MMRTKRNAVSLTSVIFDTNRIKLHVVFFTDYIGMSTIAACPEGQWKCNNFQCISESLLCNNRDDCDGDYSDEQLDTCSKY